MKSKKQLPETTYTEESLAMAAEARLAYCKSAGDEILAAIEESARGKSEKIKSDIKCLNHLRAAGEQLIRASGREQLTFDLDGKDFVRRHIQPNLPFGTSMEMIQACVRIAVNVTAPVETQEELGAIKKWLETTLQVLGVGDTHQRIASGEKMERNYFADFCSKVSGTFVLLDKIEDEDVMGPMSQWPTTTLDDFIAASKPLKEKILKAEQLRAKTIPV